MLTIFNQNNYLLKRQVFALTGKVRVYTPSGTLMLYSEQKMFKLREDIRVFEDEAKTREVLWIQARQIIDFAAAYDVTDQTTGQKVGALRRKGWRSMLRDAWEVLDPYDQVIGVIQEDSPLKAFLRRLMLGSLLPQRYEVLIEDRVAATFKQRFHLFRYELEIAFLANEQAFDPRLGLAAAILLAIIEGKQQS
ncbi:MAG: hypothetical protein E3J88_02245 [Anaerolineales bacterium]|nr:MAG: hypothetical protein E3J88_02245 [Anaerolineales bacterium]